MLLVVLVVRETAARRRQQKLRDELKSLRAQVEQTDRLVNVGQLISGLAQDLKSPLQGMLGSAELIAASLLKPRSGRTETAVISKPNTHRRAARTGARP